MDLLPLSCPQVLKHNATAQVWQGPCCTIRVLNLHACCRHTPRFTKLPQNFQAALQAASRFEPEDCHSVDVMQALDKGAADEASSPPKENESASSVLAQALAGYTIPEQPEGGSKKPADAKEGPGKQAAPASSITKGKCHLRVSCDASICWLPPTGALL